mgnify:CR=1 FL=1
MIKTEKRKGKKGGHWELGFAKKEKKAQGNVSSGAKK